MRVVCCTMFSPSHQPLADVSVPNLEAYCHKHGYDVKLINIEDDNYPFQKHFEFKKAFSWMQEGDVIWYKDVDSIITNMNIQITKFVDDKHSFFLTKDANELNGGSVVIRNTQDGRMFNDLVLDQQATYQNEQNFYNILALLPPMMNTMKILPHPSINSYKYSLYKECPEYVGREDLGDWREGNLLLHAPALSMDKRIEVLKNAKIIYD